jgi:hypothetical protein
MADDKYTAETPDVLDADGKRLLLDSEKAKYVEAIAKSRQATNEANAASLRTMLPSATDAPKGEVTVGVGAGAFGPWRAHRIVDGIATNIAKSAHDALSRTENARVLVLSDRSSLLPDHWTARQVAGTLTRLTARIDGLTARLTESATTLKTDIENLRKAEKDRQAESTTSRRRGVDAPDRRSVEPADAASEGGELTTKQSPTPSPVPGALGAAADLLGLLRTDYAITATAVTANPSELETLTAARLAKASGNGGSSHGPIRVEADTYTTLRHSPSNDSLRSLLEKRDVLALQTVELREVLTPVEAELTAIKSRLSTLEQEWATAVAEQKDVAKDLRAAVDSLARDAGARENLAGPARTLAAHVERVLTETDEAVAALLRGGEDGPAPLLMAAMRERLDAEEESERFTHVLYVNVDALGADAITRRSILGTSGRIRFVGAGSASWLLLDASDGTISDGGQVNLADVMAFDLEGGRAQFNTDGTWLANEPLSAHDPLARMETWARALVLALVVTLGVVGLLSFLAVVKTVFG